MFFLSVKKLNFKDINMPLYESSQSFNNASAKIYSRVDTDAPTMQGIVDMMPDGQSIFAPTLQASAVTTLRQSFQCNS